MSPNRYWIRQQSICCPDGFNRRIWYIWDSVDEVILPTMDSERDVVSGEVIRLNRLEERKNQ